MDLIEKYIEFHNKNELKELFLIFFIQDDVEMAIKILKEKYNLTVSYLNFQ
jgi:hypothetical protein